MAMNNRILRHQVIQTLSSAGIQFEVLPLSKDWSILITRRGGRILGPFKGEAGESVFWANAALNDSEAFQRFMESRDWNLGGDRYWMEPEVPLYIRDRSDFDGSYTVQSEIDPGRYSLLRDGDTVTLAQTVEAEVFGEKVAEKHFTMQRRVRALNNPFSSEARAYGIMECFGFAQDLSVEDLSDDHSVYLESWILTQVNPGGELIMPHTGSAAEYLNYYEPIDGALIEERDRRMWIKVTGKAHFKLGFKATSITGRSGYLGHMSNGDAYLLVKQVFNDPSNIYCGGPGWAPDKYGYSAFLYNDSGSLGGFGEYELCGKTLSGDTGIRCADDTMNYYFFFGEEAALRQLAADIL